MGKGPIRVLHVVRKMDLGGAESMIMNLYRNIDREKIQFDFLVHQKEKAAFDDEIEQLGGRIYHIKRMNGLNPVSYYRKCREFFREHGEIGIVHGHIGSCSALYLKAAKEDGRFTVVHSHSAGKVRTFRNVVFKIYSYPARHIADTFLGCSTEAGIARFGRKIVRSGAYDNFPNAIDTDLFLYDAGIREEVRRELGVEKDELLIGTVGRMVVAKNPQYMISIFEEIVRRSGGAKCIWVGYGELEDQIRRDIRSKGIEDRVILPGKRDDVARILQGMDCFIMPSIYEGLPVSAIEAQAAGLPCILSDRITRETGVTDLAGWRSIKEDPSAWAEDALRAAAGEKENRNSPVQQIYESGYDIRGAARRLEAFYLDNLRRNENAAV